MPKYPRGGCLPIKPDYWFQIDEPTDQGDMHLLVVPVHRTFRRPVPGDIINIRQISYPVKEVTGSARVYHIELDAPLPELAEDVPVLISPPMID